MGRPTTLRERNNVECPECGSILTRCRGGGRADSGERLRRRICQECGLIFCTVEVPVLYADGSPAPLTALDTEHRWYHREDQRKRVGWHGLATGRQPYAEPARIRIRMTVTPPVREVAA